MQQFVVTIAKSPQLIAEKFCLIATLCVAATICATRVGNRVPALVVVDWSVCNVILC